MMTFTTAAIEALRTEAASAGDLDMVAICDQALDGDTVAKTMCLDAIHDAAPLCAICAAADVVSKASVEIIRNANRDGLGSGKVYACDWCIAQGDDADREAMGVTAEEWAQVQARLASRC